MRYAAICSLLACCVAFTVASGSGRPPGLELSDAQARELSGGQCFYTQYYCFLANYNCTNGICLRSATSGEVGDPIVSSPGSICVNGADGTYCCGDVISTCINP